MAAFLRLGLGFGNYGIDFRVALKKGLFPPGGRGGFFFVWVKNATSPKRMKLKGGFPGQRGSVGFLKAWFLGSLPSLLATYEIRVLPRGCFFNQPK